MRVKKIHSFRTDEGKFAHYDYEKNPVNRMVMFTVQESKDGWIIRNAFVPFELQRQGIATNFYREMNQQSLKHTGKPLRSTQARVLEFTGETVIELTQEGVRFWESLVAKGYAEKISFKNYKFIER